MIERDSTVLPEPDSPTMPKVLPRSTDSETPSTARTVPRVVRKAVWRSSTTSNGPDGSPTSGNSRLVVPALGARRFTAGPHGCRSVGAAGPR